ncbi:HAD-IC family P-type ATPase [Mycobacterium sp. CVI_P3]|uniref:HAD-IC family P-type ATPase n=1 Tax=Mycobacterium pinniadriaticum TaxID=2994102 RepID=A0ABT3SAD5_9MYCO|nr:HAD-IC family P-type ATPase [Mycobacterium pinniadriaticum]MCX2929867.1 HAD-IC family P-type ATPase [Mycobacterium pinniadriaticum]MCX2936484.1 HAD-IC family P-type ATPase [Mycobacterium pinniadriaticum]
MVETPRGSGHDEADVGPVNGVAAWHARPIEAVEEFLLTSPHGLSAGEAANRLARHGRNELRHEPPPSVLVIFLRQFSGTFILVLLVAGLVTLVMGELLDTLLIAVALLLNAVIGVYQERRAADAVSALMRLVVPRCRVVRDGHEWDIDSRELVPGDVVLLESGSRVPADLRLSAVNALTIDESLLTGESLPVTKTTAPVSENAVTADRFGMAFTGTIVANGRGHGYVVATGEDTELGSIAELVRTEAVGELPLQARMARFARVVGVAVLAAAVVAFVSGLALGESAGHVFRVAVAMAVSAVPEGLPVAMTVTFAIGVTRMARRNAVLRRLPALETLGSTTVVGSDKTGTLTENRMTVQEVWAGGRFYRAPDDLRSDSPSLRLTLITGALTNEADLVHTTEGTTSTGDPTEVALLTAADAAGFDPGGLQEEYPLVAEIPFESHRRYSATIRDYDSARAVFVKGAPEQVIAMCASTLTDGGPVPMDADAAHAAARELAGRGLRVLAMAYRGLPAHATHAQSDGAEPEPGERADPDQLVLLGFQAMMDPPRAGVHAAITACHQAGVRVVMITGDHSITARAIAAELGILRNPHERVLTGTDLAHLNDAALRAVVEDVSVYARVSPNDKLRIVRALQDHGHIVAVTGDGVNDAPALRAASIGISMGEGGTDVAREASDMVLSDDNFVSIVAAIEEGRIAFANIRKVTFFLISTALAEVAAILLALWLRWPMLLVPAQILWLNLVTNGVQDLALAFEPGSRDVLKRPPRPRREGILSATMWERTAIVGVVMAAGALFMFNWQLGRDHSLVAAQSVTLTTLVLFEAFQAGNSRSENRSLFALNPLANPFLFWASLGALSLHIAAMYLPPFQYVLGIQPISAAAWIRAVLVAATILVAVEAHKAFRRWHPISARPRTATPP